MHTTLKCQTVCGCGSNHVSRLDQGRLLQQCRNTTTSANQNLGVTTCRRPLQVLTTRPTSLRQHQTAMLEKFTLRFRLLSGNTT